MFSIGDVVKNTLGNIGTVTAVVSIDDAYDVEPCMAYGYNIRWEDGSVTTHEGWNMAVSLA